MRTSGESFFLKLESNVKTVILFIALGLVITLAAEVNVWLALLCAIPLWGWFITSDGGTK